MIIILVLLLSAAVCLCLWLYGSEAFRDFGLNAFTETLGILVTVVIVDNLIKRQEERRSLPQKATAYEDVRLLTSRIVEFWSSVYGSCVPEASPKSLDKLFNADSFQKMGKFLNMDSQPNVTPPRTWWEWLPDNLNHHRKRATVILERHNNVLDPKAYAYVHQIATEGIDPGLIQSIRHHDKVNGFSRPHVLAYYWGPPEGYCQTILGLTSWCENQVKILERNGMRELRRVVSTIGPWELNEKPPSMFDEKELEKQIWAMHGFIKNN
ncbi:hypothetical protein [Nitrosospira multiformis]|uniref:hypothetical protein n=1 Tax=Nitrosospira multiformis TaxID=1231 RepID=UPI00111387B0|nr:hypothetical protein [Nitrosospira multiformis]